MSDRLVWKGWKKLSYKKMKRAVDLTLAGIGLVLLAPVFVVISIAIVLDSPGPVLFRQKRVGIHKSHFMILKFRTMKRNTPQDKATHLLEKPEKYITKVGGFLRRTSLDELPQLINIIKGDMAIVGPRPALWNQYDLIAQRDKYGANDVRPGLTGWAQINGRDELEISEKARLDGEYVKKLGPLMDLKCFFGTFGSVLGAKGVREGSVDGHNMNGRQQGKDSNEEKQDNQGKRRTRGNGNRNGNGNGNKKG